MQKKLLTFILVITLFTGISYNIHAATSPTVALLSWNLVDSGKHCDWSGTTKYLSLFKASVKTWNNYKSGVIRKDSATTIEDLVISDYSEKSDTLGVTSAKGTIKFNTYTMEKLASDDNKQNTTTHELGHALGLAHNESTDIMYYANTSKTSLSANDKASYDAAYKKY